MAINEPGQSPWDKRRNVPPNLEQFLKQLQQKFKFKANLFNIWLILAVVLVVWALTGIHFVDPDERGVVRTFGKMTAEWEPGPHYAIPLVQQVDVVKVARIRSMELGFRTIVEGPPARIRPLLVESLMITGDENLVNLKVVVQYRISDLPAYLFRVFDPLGTPEGRTLRDAAETALRGVVGSMTIDDILTVGRARVQQETKVHLQQLMDSYQTGLLITEVKLQAVEPPEPVQAAFKDVVSAKEDRERIINEARGYLEDILPKARGEAEQMLRAAEGYGEQRVAEAKGETERFLAMLVEYRQARTVTRRRLYLETMGEVLSKVDKVVISAQVAGRMLPLLPLADLVPRAEGRAPKSGEPQ